MFTLSMRWVAIPCSLFLGMLVWVVPCLAALPGDLLVANWSSREIVALDGQTGQIKSVFLNDTPPRTLPKANMTGYPVDMAFGPDGQLYVTDLVTSVWRYGIEDEVVNAMFATSTGASPASRLTGISFTSDNRLLVTSTAAVLTFNALTGNRMEELIIWNELPEELQIEILPMEHLQIGPDGNVYLAGASSDFVLRIDGQTGEFIDVFASGGGLSQTRGSVFNALGDLLVASWGSGEILRYDGITGEFLDVFASGPQLTSPNRLVFGPDGLLYVSDEFSGRILRYNGDSGAFVDVFAAGLPSPVGMVFVPGVVLGDLDENGVLDAFDVDDFELALADKQAYIDSHPSADPDELGDFNGDGFLDAFDVIGFEAALAGAGATVPEPHVGLVLLIGTAAALRRRQPRHRSCFRGYREAGSGASVDDDRSMVLSTLVV